MFEVSMIYQGKFKIINDLIWLRSEENDMISIPDNNFIRFWEKSFFSKEKENFLKQFSKKLCENDNNFLKFESFLKTCLNNYLVKEKEIHKKLLSIKLFRP